MNKLYFNLTSVATLFAVAIMAVSCTEDISGSDETTSPEYPQEPEPEYIEGYRVTATAVAPTVTRGHLVEDGDNLPYFVWDVITSAAEGGYVIKTAIVSATDGTLLSWYQGDAFTTANLSIEDNDIATLETELPVATSDISSNGTIVPATYPYIYVMQDEGQYVTSESGNLRFKVNNPFLGTTAITHDGTLESLEKGMGVYATGRLSDALTTSALDLGEVQFELIPAIFKVEVTNQRASAINIESVDIVVYKSNGTVATALASELFLEASYNSSSKSFSIDFSDESSTEYSSELSLSSVADATIATGASNSYYQMTLPSVTTPTQSTYQEWASLSFRVKYSIEGADDIYLTTLKLDSDNAFFDEGAIIPSKIYESEITVTASDILASDEVEELGEYTLRSVEGKLEDLMIAKFGSDYASTTLDKVEILGYMNQADFAAIQNVRELLLSEVMILDGDNSNMIPSEAFGNSVADSANKILERIELPADVTNIGVRAFAYCTNLTEVVFPSSGAFTVGNVAFSGSGIVNLDIPTNCTQINYRGFYECKGLVTANLKTTSIGNETFTNCTSLTTVTLVEGLSKIDSSTFEGCTLLSIVNIPNTITTINSKAFHSTLISDVTLPEALVTLGAGAFYNCDNITSITIPETTTDISTGTPGVFYGCDNLTEINVTWLKNAPAVGQYTFPTSFYVGGGNSISIPDGIDPDEVYGSDGWEYYSKAQDTPYVPAGYIYVEAGTLDAVMIVNYGLNYKDSTITDLIKLSGSLDTDDLAALQNVTQVDLTRISFPSNTFPVAFGNADSTDSANQILEYIVLPKNTTTISNSAFENCLALKECELPTSGSFTIGNRAFRASGIESIVIPSNCKQINYAAFTNALSLKSVEIQGLTGAFIGDTAFSGCTSLTEFIVPWTTTDELPTIVSTTLASQFLIGGECSITVPNDIDPDVVYGSKGWELYNKRQEIPYVDPTYVNTTAGGLNAAMELKYGSDYASSTITETVQIKGEMNSDEFEYLMNVENLDLTKATIVAVAKSGDGNAIPESTFSGSTVLKSIIMPEDLTSIGASAFESSSLTSVTFYGETPFDIGASAFKGSKLTSLEIPSVCESLGSEAFANCTSLVSVEIYGITDTTTGFGGSTFAGCSKLLDFVVGWSSIDAIPAVSATDLPESFIKGSGANSVTIPNTMNPVLFEDNGWENYNIYNDYDDSGVITSTAGNLANAMATYYGKNYADTTITTLVTITGAMNATDFAAIQNVEMLDLSGVTVADNAIPVNGFGNGDDSSLANTVLKSIVLPATVTTIGQKSFENCSALTSVTLPSTASFKIDNRAFKLSGLTSINIPANCTAINYGSFNSCNSLTSITLNWRESSDIKAIVADSIPTSFKSGGSNNITVPYGCSSIYTDSETSNGWHIFNIVEAASVE